MSLPWSSDPSQNTKPSIDFVIGGYATVPLAAAMPVVMQHNKVFVGLFGLAVNEEFKYPKYFSMAPPGPDPKPAFTKGYFEIAMQLGGASHTILFPISQTVLIWADANPEIASIEIER